MSDDQIREIEGGFFNELGVLVGKTGDHEFAIKIWKFIAERHDGSATLIKRWNSPTWVATKRL